MDPVLEQEHEPADEERNHGIERRDRQADDEHRRVPALGLPDEVPVEGEQALRRRARPGAGGRPNLRRKELQMFLLS